MTQTLCKPCMGLTKKKSLFFGTRRRKRVEREYFTHNNRRQNLMVERIDEVIEQQGATILIDLARVIRKKKNTIDLL